jgi:hypothetical protein
MPERRRNKAITRRTLRIPISLTQSSQSPQRFGSDGEIERAQPVSLAHNRLTPLRATGQQIVFREETMAVSIKPVWCDEYGEAAGSHVIGSSIVIKGPVSGCIRHNRFVLSSVNSVPSV